MDISRTGNHNRTDEPEASGGGVRSRLAGVAQESKPLLRLIGLASFALTILVFLWQLPHFLAGNNEVFPQFANAFRDVLVHQAWTLGVLLVLTAFTRTVSLRTVVAFWFLGVFAVHTLLVVIGTPFIEPLGIDTVAVWVAPFNQTVVMALVVFGFYVLASRKGTHPSISDGLLIGFAMGAGVGFHEDMTYERVGSVGPGAEYGSAGASGETIWWSYLFPAINYVSLLNIRQLGRGDIGAFTLYHPGWGALIGVGLGLAFVNRHRLPAWLAGVGVMLVTFTEHMSANWKMTQQGVPPIVGGLFVGGDVWGVSELAVYVLLTAIVAGIGYDLVTLRRTGRTYDAFPGALVALRRLGQGVNGGVSNSVRRLLALTAYARLRRAVLLQLWRSERTGVRSPSLKGALSALEATAHTAGIWEETTALEDTEQGIPPMDAGSRTV